jgi:[acyl-carrier-protein] S-malonyltransferase
MQEACEERQGGMVSVIGLARERLDEICARTGVEIANLNSAEQTVLSGEKARVSEAERLAGEAGAKRVVPLNVAGAFHSSLMRSAAARLESFLAGVALHEPRMPVVANVTGKPHGGPDEVRRTMVAQVTSPVQWLWCVEWCRAQGVGEYVECGPGKVLTGLIKRIDREAALHNIQDCETLGKTVAALRGQGG